MPISDIIDHYSGFRDECCPPRKEANCFVFAEADVAVNAFLHSGHNMEDGLYYICDVGAGTTDVAFFRFAQHAERPIIFYGTSCKKVGGDDFASILADLYRIKNPELNLERAIDQANRLLVRGLEGKKLGHLYYLGRPLLFKTIYERIFEARDRAFKQAYPKEKEMKRWKNLNVTVIGGGRQIVGVRETCQDKIYTGVGDDSIRPDEVTLRFDELPDSTPLHGIAFGLSVPAAEFYEHWKPDEVDVWVPPRKEKYEPFPYGNPYEI